MSKLKSQPSHIKSKKVKSRNLAIHLPFMNSQKFLSGEMILWVNLDFTIRKLRKALYIKLSSNSLRFVALTF